jgi:hypothetical protein
MTDSKNESLISADFFENTYQTQYIREPIVLILPIAITRERMKIVPLVTLEALLLPPMLIQVFISQITKQHW